MNSFILRTQDRQWFHARIAFEQHNPKYVDQFSPSKIVSTLNTYLSNRNKTSYNPYLSKAITPYKSVKALTPCSDFPLLDIATILPIPANQEILEAAMQAIQRKPELATTPQCTVCCVC